MKIINIIIFILVLNNASCASNNYNTFIQEQLILERILKKYD